MKKIILITFVLSLFISCENPQECIESTGAIITKEVPVETFNRLDVQKGIEVVITDGTEYKVVIQTGENLMENIQVTQIGTTIILRDNTTCNWVRDFGQTKVYITTPTLYEIYSKTEGNISSNGVLSYPDLRVIAYDTNADGLEGAGTGDFHLNVNCTNLEINSNNVARFYLSGTVSNEARLNFYAGDSRIEAQNLVAEKIIVFNRGSNDMIVHPIQSITGKLVSTGNVILTSIPPIIDVEQLYQGQLIYN